MSETTESLDGSDNTDVSSGNRSYSGEYIILGTLAVLGAALSIQSARIGLGVPSSPGPGLWPFVVSLALTLAATVSLLSPKLGYKKPSQKGIKRAGTVVLGMSLFAVAYPYTGFVPSATVAILLVAKYTFDASWLASILTAIIGSVAIYSLFAMLLDVPLVSVGN